MITTLERKSEVGSRALRPARYACALLCEIMQRRAAFQHCDQYITSSEFSSELQAAWAAIKLQESENFKPFQNLLAGQCDGNALIMHDRANHCHPGHSSPAQ